MSDFLRTWPGLILAVWLVGVVVVFWFRRAIKGYREHKQEVEEKQRKRGRWEPPIE